MTKGDMKPGKELLFLALGGSGEIGMNVNLYGCEGKWVMVDLGLTFADPAYPGVELVLPDLAFIEERRDDLLGIVLTHGHEDHIGAIPYLAHDLGVPLYATPFTAGLIAGKLEEEGLTGQVKLNTVEMEGDFRLGPFGFRYIPLAHSIPEGNALLIDTPYGRVFHTGDWKLDDTPQLGDPSTEAELRAIGDAGVLALVCDSTNVFQEASSGSELGVRQGLDEVIQGPRAGCSSPPSPPTPRGCKTLGHVAQDTGRQVCVAGRCLDRILRVSKSVGYLTDFPETIDFDEAMSCRAREVMIIATGGQGEPRAALARIAFDQHKLSARPRRPRHLLVQADPRQRDRHRPHPERARRQGHRDDHRPPGAGPRLRPSRPSRARRDVRLDPPRDHRPRPWRDAPHDGAGPLRPRPRHPARHRPEEWRSDPARARTARKSSPRSRSAGSILDGDVILPADGSTMNERRRLAASRADLGRASRWTSEDRVQGERRDRHAGHPGRGGSRGLPRGGPRRRRRRGRRRAAASEDKLREAVRLAVRRCATEWTGKKPVVSVLIVRV